MGSSVVLFQGFEDFFHQVFLAASPLDPTYVVLGHVDDEKESSRFVMSYNLALISLSSKSASLAQVLPDTFLLIPMYSFSLSASEGFVFPFFVKSWCLFCLYISSKRYSSVFTVSERSFWLTRESW